ncbi:MAG: thiamine diphosphokinase [Melioribacteraceae bacterium]|nr:MAG: thiamine diphosphokinase [Melioribacteraceae bacterium]
MKKALILANGLHPKKSVIQYLQNNGYKTLVCADGGANSAFKLGITPDFIIGDLDSINPTVKKFYESKSKIIKYKRQNDTDVEKCLKVLIKKKYDEVILLGATGDRLDHSYCNLGIVLKFFNEIKINILHQKSFLKCFSGKVVFNTIKDEIISLYGIDGKTKIKSNGLKYPLENISLPFGVKESTSNVAIGGKVELKITGGKIFVIRDFNTLRKNGYFQQS